MKRKKTTGGRRLLLAMLIATAAAGGLIWIFPSGEPETVDPMHPAPVPTAEVAENSPVPAEVPNVPATATPSSPGEAGTPDTLNGTELRPLPVAITSGTHEWTTGDGFDLAVLERIALNPDHLRGMVDENDRIHRRQLVYRNETAALAVQRARLEGEPVRRLTLPALDGEELDFVIDRSDLQPSGQAGTFTGRLADRPDSLVTLAFQFGREAFTVISPEDDLYLQADPREPGEIIVKSIDPTLYAHAPCGNPDHNH